MSSEENNNNNDVDNYEIGEEEIFDLHKSIWKNDQTRVEALLNKHKDEEEYINLKDTNGNAPLHIAAHFADREMINLLLKYKANPELLSKAGWRPLEESIASGAMEEAVILMKAGLEKYREDMVKNAAIWHKNLIDIPDFYMEIKWDFSFVGASWVPFVSNFVPNDVYRVYKRGSSFRMDYTLVGFKNFKIERGERSFIFCGEDSEEENKGHLFILNHDEQKKQDFCLEPSDTYTDDINSALQYLFAHDICSHLPVGCDDDDNKHQVEFIPAKGWWSGSPVIENVNGYKSRVYNTKGMEFRSLIRSDPHAKETRIPRSLQSEDLFNEENDKYEDYFDENPVEQGPPSGLVWSNENVRRNIRKFEGKMWISKDFPLSVEHLLYILEIYSPTNQTWKALQDFISMNIPDGFPVKIQIPVFYLLSATIQFDNFRYETPDLELFDIPDYELINEAYTGAETREMFKSVRDNNNNNNK